MKDVKSLRAGIFTEIIIVILPLTILLVFQTVNDITVSDKLADAHRLHTASTAAHQKFKLFLNGVVDAVDTGKLAEDAVTNLQKATIELKSASRGDNALEFSVLAAKSEELLRRIPKDRSLQGLLPLRDDITGIDAELAALDVRCGEASHGVIKESVNSARIRKKIVFAALLSGMVVTGWLILLLVRHIKQFEDALRESEERMRVMFESINAGIVLVDCGTRTIADVNPAALRMYGGPKEELIGRSCLSLFHSGNDTLCPIQDEGKSIEISKRELNLHNGEQLTILKSVNCVTVGGRPYMLESFVDLTEQVELETALLSAKEAAEAASRAKSIFLANMSHEIRTPMNAILGYSQLLRRDRTLTPQQENYLDIINRSGEHLLKLINDILEMSKIEAGTVNHTLTPFNFHELLKDMESLFRVRTGQKGLRFSIDLAAAVPVMLRADGGKVRQVLINLISNSLKFTDQGGISVRVEAEPGGSAKWGGTQSSVVVTVDVEDSGSGIAADEFDKVFASFEQTESGRHKIGGTGLGMPISRQFARLMGGDLLLLQSEPGVGSKFRFTFRAEIIEVAELAQTAATDRCVRRIAPNEKEWRILVVDDQETNRSLLTQVLTQAGFAVREAVDGAGGVAGFLEWSPDLILMDILMPEMNGYDAMEKIKATKAGASTPIIAITASVMTEERQSALDRGFDGFIMKPVPMEYLFEEIRRLTNVAYIYDDIPAGAGAAALTPLAAWNLTPLSADLLATMRDALDAGDMAALRKLIDSLGESEPDLAANLRSLVDTYAYDSLNALFTEEAPSRANA